MIGLMEYYDRAPGIVGGDKQKAAELPDQIMRDQQGGRLHREGARCSQRQSPPPLGEIEQAWVQAVQADPSRYEPHVNLASIYAGGTTPRWELAEKEALTAKKIDADRDHAVRGARGGLRDGERWAELDAILAEAEKQIPDNLDAVPAGVGRAARRPARICRARSATRGSTCRRSRSRTSTSPAVAHWRLGLILEKEGRKPEAIAELQTAVKLEPKFEQAQKDLEAAQGRYLELRRRTASCDRCRAPPTSSSVATLFSTRAVEGDAAVDDDLDVLARSRTDPATAAA